MKKQKMSIGETKIKTIYNFIIYNFGAKFVRLPKINFDIGPFMRGAIKEVKANKIYCIFWQRKNSF